MGTCTSVPGSPTAKSAAIDAQLNRDFEVDKISRKLLLLGAGESGKSTIFKQLVTLHGEGFNQDAYLAIRPVVYSNLLTSMSVLIDQVRIRRGELEFARESREAVELLDRVDAGVSEVNNELGDAVALLWKDPAIRQVWEVRSKFQIPDTAAYFFERIEDIQKDDYIPSYEDLLRVRVRSTGINETEFEIDKRRFTLIDVGGQRNERKKWIHCFQDVTAVIFVAAISEYDQVCFEDHSTNRVVEALHLLEDTITNEYFTNISFVLFLNKRDLFAEKIPRVPLAHYFPNFPGPANDYEAGVSFMKDLFEEKCFTAHREIYTHITCATDKQNVFVVFNATKDVILKQSLRDSGLYVGAV